MDLLALSQYFGQLPPPEPHFTSGTQRLDEPVSRITANCCGFVPATGVPEIRSDSRNSRCRRFSTFKIRLKWATRFRTGRSSSVFGIKRAISESKKTEVV